MELKGSLPCSQKPIDALFTVKYKITSVFVTTMETVDLFTKLRPLDSKVLDHNEVGCLLSLNLSQRTSFFFR